MAEILAPVGGAEQLIAAVRCGADAVYLGAGGFNARRNAENFGDGRLAEAVAYCHARRVAVHVTVNTLVTDDELDDLAKTTDEVAAAGADAVITQDLAVAAHFRRRVPAIARHASTQMTIHDLDGAKLCADLGFSRVVLSRELTLKEIEHITARCGIETEVFIHGALCMCMSGACYLSSMLGGRSGNRGLCAQPCRLDFRAGERGCALSLKDMSHLHYLKTLAEAGVASFKIEGRMKRPEYVAAAVTAARLALAGEPYDEDTLRAVFSRSGFTDGYLTGKRDLSMFGTRQKEDVTAAGEVLGKLRDLYRAERQSVPVDLRLTVTAEVSSLTARAGGEAVTVTGETPQAALNRPLDGESARRSLLKTGGTPFFAESFAAEVEPGLMLPVSALNALRREALGRLERQLGEARALSPAPYEKRPLLPHHATGTELRGRFQRPEQAGNGALWDKILLPVREITPELMERWGDKLMAELPALLFDGDRDKLAADLEKLGLRHVCCDNLYAVALCRELGLTLHGGAGLNVMNSEALAELESLGLADATVSFELSMAKLAALGGSLPRGLIGYGRLPLMRFRNCPARNKKGCGGCDGRPVLRDRRNVEFPLLCEERRFGTLLNSVPLYVGDRPLPAVDFVTLWFTTETPREAARVTALFREGREADFPRTRGLYWRELL